MQRPMPIAMLVKKAIELAAYAAGPVCGQLLGNSQMEAQMQERIGLPLIRCVVALDVKLPRVEQRMVFGMQGDDLDRSALEIA